MSPGDQALELLRTLSNKGAEFKAFESALRELNTTLVELLAARESQQMPDIAGAMKAALATLKAPTVNLAPAAVSVSPQLVTPPGAAWSVKVKRTIDGFDMTVTKL